MALDVELIRSSFETAKPIAAEIADKFYEFLWEDYPDSYSLFQSVNMDKQKKALIGSLVYIVDHLDNTEKLVDYLKKMGGRHVKYGAKEEHYAWVGNTLIKTFAHFFEDGWTEELEETWTEAYHTIAELMLSGASEEVPSGELIVEKARGIAGNLLNDVLQDSLDEEFTEAVRAKVRKVIFEVLEEESQSLLKKVS